MTAVGNGATLEHHIGSNGRFHLRQLSGDIRIRGVDGDAVRVRERSGRSITEALRVDSGPGSLALSAPDKFGLDLMVFGFGRRSSLDLEIEVPRGADVSIETANATIEASGLQGMTKVRTASGDVTMDGAGGVLELDSVSGEVSISAVAPLDLRARTVSGDCTVVAPQLGRAVVETTSGDVRLDALLSGRGPFEIQSVSGDATVVGRSGIRVEARTITGEMRSDLPHRRETAPGRKSLVVGDGGTPLGFKSISGDLRVVAPRSELPPVHPTAPMAPVAPVPPIAPVAPVAPTHSDGAGLEASRLEVLRALERGELDVDAAMARLAEIGEA